MVPPPQLLEEIARKTPIPALTADFRDCALPVDGGKQALPPRVDGQVKVVKGMIAIDEYRRRARRQSLPHGASVRQTNGLVAWPGLAIEVDGRIRRRAVVSVSHDSVAHHGSPKKFDGGVLVFSRHLGQPGLVRR